ncbi:MAG: PorV/PorQ family protein [bacterium]
MINKPLHLSFFRQRRISLWLIICYLSFAIAGTAIAGVGSSSGAELLRLGGGARPIALADSYVGLADDVSAMHYNPAGLSQIEFPEIISMSNNSFGNMHQQMFGAATPMGVGVIAVGFSGISSGTIPGYSATGEAASAFDTNSSVTMLSFGRRINSKLAVGVGVKGVSERLESAGAATMAFDLGLHYRYNRFLTLGLSILNYGGALKFAAEETPLPTSYRFGGSLQTSFFGEEVNIVSDVIAYDDESNIGIGAEYVLREAIVVRGGMRKGVLYVGLGVTANLLALDYAYRNHQDLGATSQISLSILFGATERAKKKFFEYVALGKAYLQSEDYGNALVNFERAVNLNPKDEEVNLLLQKAQLALDNQSLEKIFKQKTVEQKRSVDDILGSAEKFLKKEKYVEALAELSKVLELDPNNREAILLQSRAQLQMEKELVRRSKTEALTNLGEAMNLIVLSQYEEALEKVNAALALDTKNSEALALKKKLSFILKLEKK